MSVVGVQYSMHHNDISIYNLTSTEMRFNGTVGFGVAEWVSADVIVFLATVSQRIRGVR